MGGKKAASAQELRRLQNARRPRGATLL